MSNEINKVKEIEVTFIKKIEEKDMDLENNSLQIKKYIEDIDKAAKEVDNRKTEIDFIKNIDFSTDLVNATNYRNKKNKKSLNKPKFDRSSNNDLGKRKFSTLNFNKHNNKLSNSKNRNFNYNPSSPIYQKLLTTLINEPLNISTQIKIETSWKDRL